MEKNLPTDEEKAPRSQGDDMMEKVNGNAKRFRFTKADLLAVTVPEGRAFVEVQDTEVKALRCRVSAGGKMTMYMDKKVEGRHVKKSLGAYIPGPGGSRIEDFRTKARGALVEINEDSSKWLEGEQAVDAEDVTVQDVFDRTLKASDRGAMGIRDWNEASGRFIAWMKANHPAIQTWARVKRPHLVEYRDAQKPTKKNFERGIKELSATRIRLLMQPIVQVGNWAAVNLELPNPAVKLDLKTTLKDGPKPVYLIDVLMFLDHLKARELSSLEAGAALAGLGGLQMLEALRLTWDKVDLSKGLIEISGEVKNPFRNRVIPLPDRCVQALKRAHAARPSETVQDMNGGPVITSPMGRPFHGTSWINYSKLVKAEMRRWNPRIGWSPKDLRNCLLTLGMLKGFAGDALEQYCGHAPKTVTARHYVPRLSTASIGEALQLEDAMGAFKRLVVEHVEREIQAETERARRADGNVQELAVNED